MQASASLVAFGKLHEELEEKGVLHHFLNVFGAVDDLLDEPLLDSHDSIVLHLGREITEQALDYKLQ